MLTLTHLGHSCFTLRFGETIILTDPCDPSTGYHLKDIVCDAVSISHDHHDHNYINAASGAPLRIAAPGAHAAGGVSITGVPSYHDDARGQKRGENTIYRFEGEGFSVVHLGDLGHTLDWETAASVGDCDILLCPVGGVYTIDANQALEVAGRLNARLVIPMHYQTPELSFRLDSVDAFLRAAEDAGRTIRFCAEQTVCFIEKPASGQALVLGCAGRENG